MMLVDIKGEQFREYPLLSEKQQLHVQWLMWDYYRLAWHDLCRGFVTQEECPYTPIDMMYEDIEAHVLNEEYECCKLLRDTIENSEHFHNQSLRGYRSYDKKDL